VLEVGFWRSFYSSQAQRAQVDHFRFDGVNGVAIVHSHDSIDVFSAEGWMFWESNGSWRTLATRSGPS
jgi:hypothetical protein